MTDGTSRLWLYTQGDPQYENPVTYDEPGDLTDYETWYSQEAMDAVISAMPNASLLEDKQAEIIALTAERDALAEKLGPDMERYAHLRQRGFAPGSYFCFCSDCGKQHNADKRAWRCLSCAENAIPPSQPTSSDS